MEPSAVELMKPLNSGANDQKGIKLIDSLSEIEKILNKLKNDYSADFENKYTEFFKNLEEAKLIITPEKLESSKFKEVGLSKLKSQKNFVKGYKNFKKKLNVTKEQLKSIEKLYEKKDDKQKKVLNDSFLQETKTLIEKINNFAQKLSKNKENNFMNELCILSYEGKIGKLKKMIAEEYVTMYKNNFLNIGEEIDNEATKNIKILELDKYLIENQENYVKIGEFFKPGIYSFTPFIYSIWGNEDNKDSSDHEDDSSDHEDNKDSRDHKDNKVSSDHKGTFEFFFTVVKLG